MWIRVGLSLNCVLIQPGPRGLDSEHRILTLNREAFLEMASSHPKGISGLVRTAWPGAGLVPLPRDALPGPSQRAL